MSPGSKLVFVVFLALMAAAILAGGSDSVGSDDDGPILGTGDHLRGAPPPPAAAAADDDGGDGFPGAAPQSDLPDDQVLSEKVVPEDSKGDDLVSGDHQNGGSNVTAGEDEDVVVPAAVPAAAANRPRAVNVNCKKMAAGKMVGEGLGGETSSAAAPPTKGSEKSGGGADESLSAADLKTGEVAVMNSTEFLRVWTDRNDPKVGPNRTVEAECWLVMFYADWCPFSAAAAPAFNGLARAFPDVAMMAVESGYAVNTQFGVMALPTFALFHNAKVTSKLVQSLNHPAEPSPSLTGELTGARLAEFLSRLTGLKNATDVTVVLDRDRIGPLSSRVAVAPDHNLYAAWLFILACAAPYFYMSPFCQRLVEYLRNNWQEAEIQHEHID